MRTFLFIVLLLELHIVAPLPSLERWQTNYRARMRAGIQDYLPENPKSEQARALLREICALPDPAHRE